MEFPDSIFSRLNGLGSRLNWSCNGHSGDWCKRNRTLRMKLREGNMRGNRRGACRRKLTMKWSNWEIILIIDVFDKRLARLRWLRWTCESPRIFGKSSALVATIRAQSATTSLFKHIRIHNLIQMSIILKIDRADDNRASTYRAISGSRFQHNIPNTDRSCLSMFLNNRGGNKCGGSRESNFEEATHATFANHQRKLLPSLSIDNMIILTNQNSSLMNEFREFDAA